MKKVLILIIVTFVLYLSSCSNTVDVEVDDVKKTFNQEIVTIEEYNQMEDFEEYYIGKVYNDGEEDEILSIILHDTDHLSFLATLFIVILYNTTDEIMEHFGDVSAIDSVYIDNDFNTIYLGGNNPSDDSLYENMYPIDLKDIPDDFGDSYLYSPKELRELLETYSNLYRPEELGVILRHLLNSNISSKPYISFDVALGTLVDTSRNSDLYVILSICDNEEELLVDYIWNQQEIVISFTELTDDVMELENIVLIRK